MSFSQVKLRKVKSNLGMPCAVFGEMGHGNEKKSQ